MAAGQQRSPLARLTGLLLSSTPAAGPQLDLTGLDISLTLSQTLTGAAAGQGECYKTPDISLTLSQTLTGAAAGQGECYKAPDISLTLSQTLNGAAA